MKTKDNRCPKCANSRTQRHCGSRYCTWRICKICTRIGDLIFDTRGNSFGLDK